MTSTPNPDLPVEWVSDKIDLDALFKDAKAVGDGREWACASFFKTDEEHRDFLAWYRAERHRDLA